MGVLGLSEQEELLLTRIVLNRAMLGECEGAHPPFLEAGQTLCAWFCAESEEQVHDYQAQLLRLLPANPRVEQALSQKDWYIDWREGKYYLRYRRPLPARVVASLSRRLIAVAAKKEIQWFVAGLVIGMVVVHSLLKPESLLVPKLLVFVVSFCFYGFVALLGGMFVFIKLITSLDGDVSAWTRTQQFLFWLVLMAALGIGLAMGVWAPGQVRHDDNPWRQEVDQTYPY